MYTLKFRTHCQLCQDIIQFFDSFNGLCSVVAREEPCLGREEGGIRCKERGVERKREVREGVGEK